MCVVNGKQDMTIKQGKQARLRTLTFEVNTPDQYEPVKVGVVVLRSIARVKVKEVLRYQLKLFFVVRPKSMTP